MSKGPPPPKDPGPPPRAVPPGPSPGEDPCSTIRDIDATVAGAAPMPGDRIGVILDGREVLVLAAGRRIGAIVGADADELRSCIERGWRFYGEVVATAADRATLRIHGAR
jgi:hypothetical protein